MALPQGHPFWELPVRRGSLERQSAVMMRSRPHVHRMWCTLLLGLSSHAWASGQDSGSQDRLAGTTQVAPGQSIVKTFPESAQVELHLPVPLLAADAEYFAWISGAATKESGIVGTWVAMMGSTDAGWCSELFESLRGPASEYVGLLGDPQNLGDRAKYLKALMSRRDLVVAELFSRERAALKALLVAAGSEESDQEAVVEQVMMVRRADAFSTDATYAPHLTANILRLLFVAANDKRTSPEASAALRQLALDHTPRVCEQRRLVLEAIAKSGYRGYEALSRTVAAGGPPNGAMASVFRPIALGSARVAVTNQEVAALARAELAPGIGKQLDDTLLQLTYGPLAVDIFAFDQIEDMLMPLIPQEERAAASALVLDSTRQRFIGRDRMLREFDAAQRKFVERGLVRDKDTSERFGRGLLAYFQSSHNDAVETIARLGEMARTNPAWSEDAFVDARKKWNSAIQERLQEVITSGAVSPVVPHSKMEALVREVSGP